MSSNLVHIHPLYVFVSVVGTFWSCACLLLFFSLLFCLPSVVQALVENVVGVLLNGEGRVSEKGKIFDSSWIIEVNEDTGSFASDWLKDSLQKTNEVKGRERFGDL